MKDLLLRLQRAMPRMLVWVSDLHAQSQGRAHKVVELAMPELERYWPRDLLETSRSVVVDAIPFPPVGEYGLAEFESMAAMPMAGITFGNMYFIQKTQASESIHAHELVHVVQWNALGLRQFLFTYAVGIAQHGYEKSPFEAAAYAVQREFEAGRSIPGLVDTISLHARETQAKAEEVLRHHGLRMT